MTSTDVSSNTATQLPEAGTVDMKLEVVTLPVSDVDRAKRFYQSLGWRLDTDIALTSLNRTTSGTAAGIRSAVPLAKRACPSPGRSFVAEPRTALFEFSLDAA
jgi:catechol 2,3-dioxygenase-like lactoylglutathione lyase family enzyme